MAHYDIIILGAGAAGMMAAIEAGKRGRSVMVVDHAKYPGEKIRISGGGRCNFTNTNTQRDRFLSQNSRFALSALSRYTPTDFIAMVKRHGIAFHEKTLGQLFCDSNAQQIISMLTTEMRAVGVKLALSTNVASVNKTDNGFAVALSDSNATCDSLIVATGGKSIPKMGATSFGYQLASQFGLRTVETRPALVPLTFEAGALERLKPLAGIATDVAVSHGKTRFDEALLFTHRGLSGPAILQISSFWREGDQISIDLLPGRDVMALLREARAKTPKLQIQTVISAWLPKKLAQLLSEDLAMTGIVGDFSDKKLATVDEALSRWTLKPVGSEGYRTAEVTLGGIDTRDLDAKTMAARAVHGLYFIGEVVDVTGWLGGYNFQWAWASGWAAGQVA
ncbi:NAD(P)/FAD-dependent oxidoreductase [Devosia algicola]|uniref:NAD(P)/FAD-dependent oxidoreductase n=1 Tax=Devosia algicola TaxID=3026418 RepID=A0ABY7YKB2_9HYPH|nr:NAD(P)/FAD-dependent oxidoreductase [Devosia algicola]WDR01672.1 NAD(P)/FAD-dependent oxidoreductase [Devosia algicola]